MPQKPKTDTEKPGKSNVVSITSRIQKRQRRELLQLLSDESGANRVFYDGAIPFVMVTEGAARGVYRLFFKVSKETGEDYIAHYDKLINCSVEILRASRPHADVKNGIAQAFCKLTNPEGHTLEIEVNDQVMREESYRKPLFGFAEVHPKKTVSAELWSFLEVHIRATNPLIQDGVDSYGWHTDRQDRLIFALENGCETKDGFEGEDKSLTLLQQPKRRTYQGSNAVEASDDVMKLLLEDLNPYADDIQFALCGSFAHLTWPESGGKAPYNLEVVGVTRVGKSSLINFWLSLFTSYVPTGARKLRPPLLSPPESKKDTVLGRNLILASAKHLPVLDADYKYKPNDARHQLHFEKAYQCRRDLIESYGDGILAGVISGRDRRAHSRAEYQGLVLRTLEEDYATHSILCDSLSIELRANTFHWPVSDDGRAIPSNRDISIEIERRLPEIYAWGQSFRLWVMTLSEEQRQRLYEASEMRARDLVEAGWHIQDKEGDLYHGHAVYAITGVLLWLEFLKAKHQTSFMVDWFEARIASHIESRIARVKWLVEQVQENEQPSLGTVVSAAIRWMCAYGDFYIADHAGEPIDRSNGWPIPPSDLGYRKRMPNEYQANRLQLGCLTKDESCIDFPTESFYRFLQKHAEANKQTLPSQRLIWKELADEGVIVRSNSKSNPYAHVARKGTDGQVWCRVVRMPLYWIWDIAEGSDQQ